MFPTINKRFLLKVVVVVLLLSGSVFGIHAVQARRIPDALKRQADRASADNKPDAAIGFLRQYLEFRPTDADAQERFAELLKVRVGNGPPTELLYLYEKILRNDPTRHATRRDAVKAALRLGRYTDAATHAEELLKQFHTEPALWRDLGDAQAGQGRSVEAVASYEKAIELAPTETYTYQELAQYQFRQLNQPAQARATLDRLVAALPHDPQPYLTRARFETLVGDGSKGIPDIRKALEVDPENADGLLALAEQLQKGRDLLAAHDCLSDARKLYPGDTRVIRALAWLELNRGNLGAAVAVLEDGLEHVQDGFELMVPLADLLVQMGDADRPKAIAAKLETAAANLDAARMNPGRAKVLRMQTKYLTGRLAIRNQQWAAAIDVLTKLRQDAYNLPGLENQTDLLLSTCHQRLGDTEAEVKLILGVLNRDPNNVAARGALASAYLNNGRFDEAIPEYERVTQSPYSTPESHVTLLKLRATRLRTTPGATSAQWDELERSMEPVVKKLGSATTDAARLRAEISALRGARDRSVAILQKEVARRPRDSALWAALAVATADLGGVPLGLAVLDEAQAIAGDGADLRLCRATLYARDPAKLRPIDPLAAHIDTWPDADQLRLLLGLIEVYDRIADDRGILTTYRRIVGRRPAELPLWEAMFERAVKAGDTAAMTEARAAIAKLEKTPGKAAALCTAWEVIVGRRATDAPAALAAVVAQFGQQPDRFEACIALARLKALSGDASSPLELLERAVKLEPKRFAPVHEYIEFLASTGDHARLASFLDRLNRDFRWAGEPLQRVVRQSLKKLEPEKAKGLIEAAAKLVEWVPGGTGWVGDCYAACGMKAEAVAQFNRATAAKSATADDWLRSAVRGEGAEVMKKAKEALAGPLYLTVSASYRESATAPKDWTADTTTAAERRQFAQARLALKLSQFDRSAAIGVLEDYLADKSLTAADTAWARQNLAMLLVARGNPTDRAQAKELLTGASAVAGTTADEKRSTVAVLATLSRHLDGTDRTLVLERAVALLELVATETKQERDRFLLAQMHRTAGHRAAGRKLLIDLLSASPKNLDYLICALDEATEPEDVTFAEQCAKTLQREFPNEFRVVAAVARFECRAGRPERALAVADAYVRASDATPNDLQHRSSRSGELLDELARQPKIRGTDIGRKMTDAAVKKFEILYATRPEAVVAVAGLLAADARTADAFAQIDRHTKSLPARVKVMAGLAAVRPGGATADQLKKVGEWLATAKNEEPASVSVLLHEGELCSLARDQKGAEKAYAAVVDKDPTNVVALNNLAWTLSADADAAARVKELIDRAAKEVGLTGELLDTRSRMRIAAKQYDAAEQDLKHALAMETTPVRLFHMALLNDLREKPDAAKKWFKQAVDKGLDERMLNPADVVKYKAMAR